MEIHRVSLVIRTYNEERHIGRLIDGIEHQNLPDGVEVEIIVVDSGSTDSTVPIASHMGAKIVPIKKEDFTFGRALNIGCEAATGEILVLASAHVYPVYSDWLEKMIRPFSNPKVGSVYGRQIGNEITKYSEHQVFKKWFPEVGNDHQDTPFCNNANCAVRKELWLKLPYDEEVTGLEDLDWAKKIIKKGYHLVYEAEAVIVHVHEETPQKVRNRYMREAIALKGIMPEVHFNIFDFLRMLLSNAFSDWIHAIREGVFIREWKGIWSFRYNQFYGTYKGHNQKGEISQDLKNRFYYPKGLRKKVLTNLEERKGKAINYK